MATQLVTSTINNAIKKLSCSNLHQLLNDMSALSKFTELIEDRGLPYSKYEALINEVIDRINLTTSGKTFKVKSKVHSWPSWVLKIGD